MNELYSISYMYKLIPYCNSPSYQVDLIRIKIPMIIQIYNFSYNVPQYIYHDEFRYCCIRNVPFTFIPEIVQKSFMS